MVKSGDRGVGTGASQPVQAPEEVCITPVIQRQFLAFHSPYPNILFVHFATDIEHDFFAVS